MRYFLPPMAICTALAATGATQEGTTTKAPHPLVQTHCVRCHSGSRPKGKLDLQGFELASAAPELLVEILDRVRSSEMPPIKDESIPVVGEFSEPLRAQLLQDIEIVLAELAPDPGRPTLRRLNRHEYGNSVRTLLGIDTKIEHNLPEDASSGGFDNQGDVLFVTPRIAELFLDATQQAIEEFISNDGPQRFGLTVEGDASLAMTVFLERALISLQQQEPRL